MMRLAGLFVLLLVGDATAQANQPSVVAQFDVKPLEPVAQSEAVFIDRSTTKGSTLASWHWDFGDGSSAVDEQRPRHVYARPGNYTVTLRVADVQGNTAFTEANVRVLPRVEGPPQVTADHGIPGLDLPPLIAVLLVLAVLAGRRES